MNVIPSDWFRSLVLPAHNKLQHSPCDNHKTISLTNIISKALASIVIQRSIRACEVRIRKKPGWSQTSVGIRRPDISLLSFSETQTYLPTLILSFICRLRKLLSLMSKFIIEILILEHYWSGENI